MFQLQQEDDSLQDIIKHLQTVNEPLQHQPTQKGHYGYQYILRQGEALRVKQLCQDKETLNKTHQNEL